MQENENNINTISIFGLNNQIKEEKNIENNEVNMEIEDQSENKDIIKIEKIKSEEENNNKEEESKKEPKEKRRVRGPNKCYRIIEEFFNEKKRTKNILSNKDTSQSKINENINEEDEDNNTKKIKKRIKVVEMSEKFDEFLNFVKSEVNEDYYNQYIYVIINKYKEFYIEKEKEFKNNKQDFKYNIDDENLIKKKKIYGLENFLEIPEIVNDFMKYIYQQNIFKTDESIVEMIEIIFIFCVWLKQNHYTSYNVEYLINKEE